MCSRHDSSSGKRFWNSLRVGSLLSVFIHRYIGIPHTCFKGIHAGENNREQKMNKSIFIIIFQYVIWVLQKKNKSGTLLSTQAVLEK